MSGPAGVIGPVTARMSAIEQRIAALGAGGRVAGVVGTVTAGAAFAAGDALATTGSTSFAAALANAGAVLPTDAAGGIVSSAWAIPWAAGTEPADLAPTTGVTAARQAAVTARTSAASPVSAASGSDASDALAVTSPLKGRLTQEFGPTTSKYSAPRTVNGVHYAHYHDGIDIAAPLGRPVRSMAAGEVEFAGRYPDGAQVVRVRHADGSVALYAHLGRGLDVKEGDKVAAGDQIGVVGMTGNTTGPHLHFELTVAGKPVDPLPVIESGRLPGAKGGALDTSVLGASAVEGASTEALARFDRIAADIPHAAAIRSAAVEAGIDPLLLVSLVKHESGFRADAVSSCGAMGLTQLMPATAKAAHLTDPFDPAQNLRAGAKYLAGNLRIYGRVDLALAAYQAGKGAVAHAGGIPDSPTTHRYIDRILQSWAGYMEAAA